MRFSLLDVDIKKPEIEIPGKALGIRLNKCDRRD
jgi:hypothetical protein